MALLATQQKRRRAVSKQPKKQEAQKMSEPLTTIKVSKEMHTALTKRADRLGMTMAAYVDRLLRMALELNKEDPVKEFTALSQFKDTEL